MGATSFRKPGWNPHLTKKQVSEGVIFAPMHQTVPMGTKTTETFLGIKGTVFLLNYTLQEPNTKCLLPQCVHFLHHAVGLCFPFKYKLWILQQNLNISIRFIQNFRFSPKGLYLFFFLISVTPSWEYVELSFHTEVPQPGVRQHFHHLPPTELDFKLFSSILRDQWFLTAVTSSCLWNCQLCIEMLCHFFLFPFFLFPCPFFPFSFSCCFLFLF